MESVDFGVMKKKRGVTATPNSAIAKNAIVNHSSNMGKKRVQGGNGVGQGNKGWQSQHNNAGGGYGKQINPIINSLSKAPTYETPKITESLLTEGGFNQALGVVGARNNAKLKSQNQRVLQGVLGSLVSGDSQNRATASRDSIAGMRDATDRRGQDFSATAKAEALAETSTRNKSLSKYYEGQNDIGEERNSIAREKLTTPNQKAVNPLDERIKRQKLIKDGALEGIIGTDSYNSLSSEQQQDIAGKYILSGELPTVSRGEEGTFFDDPSTVSYKPQGEQAPTAQQPNTQGTAQPKVTGALFDNISKGLGIDRGSLKLSDDGQSIVLPDGREAPVSLLTEKFGG